MATMAPARCGSQRSSAAAERVALSWAAGELGESQLLGLVLVDDAPQLTRSAGAVFTGWQEAFTALFRRHRLPEDRSRRLAALVVAAEEGAVILCRAEQSTAPMEAVATEIHDLLVHALSTRPAADTTTRP